MHAPGNAAGMARGNVMASIDLPAVRGRGLVAAQAAQKRYSRQTHTAATDPTQRNRPYSDAEYEFIRAMNQYIERTGRRFPSWSQALEVLLSLGYRKPA